MGGPAMLSYADAEAIYHADTCTALKRAANAGEVELRALSRDAYPGVKLKAGHMPELRTVGYWDAARDQEWGLDWHRNEGIEFTLLSRGKVEFAVDNGTWRLNPGTLTITRPWQRHRVGGPSIGASRLSWLILDVGVRRPNQRWRWPDWLVLDSSELDRLTTLLQHNETPVWPADREVAEAFGKLNTIVRSEPDPAQLSRLKLGINELLLATLNLLARQPMTLDPGLSSARRMVSMFLSGLGDRAEHDWSVDEMARACGLGVTRFSQYCVEITNRTPVAYLNGLRIERARRLMTAHPDMSLTMIGALCGFQTSQYFSYRFKAETGQAPRHYRRERVFAAMS